MELVKNLTTVSNVSKFEKKVKLVKVLEQSQNDILYRVQYGSSEFSVADS